MGVRVELSPHLFRLMSVEDQQRYGQTNIQTTIAVPKLNRHPSPKRSVAERKEQGAFASWLLLQNSNGQDPVCLARDSYPEQGDPRHARFLGRNQRSVHVD
jgi:hypothetical protein